MLRVAFLVFFGFLFVRFHTVDISWWLPVIFEHTLIYCRPTMLSYSAAALTAIRYVYSTVYATDCVGVAIR